MKNKKWTKIIRPKNGWFDIDLKALWRYRDLAVMFTKKNFVTIYKQTILGPLWIILNPFLTTVVFTIVFGQIAGIETQGVPQFLFYMAGNTLWALFASCLTTTASTFTANAGILEKVYFPRLIMPISAIMTALINFAVQFIMFSIFLSYYQIKGAIHIQWSLLALALPIVLQVALLGLGIGIIISGLTTKYRDLAIAVPLVVQLWLYASPVVYPASTLSDVYKDVFMLNPVAPALESFRFIFLGVGENQVGYWCSASIITICVLGLGIILFSRVEKTFTDTV